jgi:hypothetical protein
MATYRPGQFHGWLLLVALAATLCSGCASDQIHSSAHHSNIALQKGDLETSGLAFITPSTVTGQEEDKQALGFIFGEVMREMRPDIPLVSLPQTLSAINKAGIADSYKAMYADYGDTGIFRYDILKEIGKVTGARYLAQIKLSSFDQQSKGRFSALGLRIIQTQEANIRLFFQIWDSQNGAIVWEGTEEVTYSWDSSSEQPVTFRKIVEKTARNLISKLP